MAVGDVVLKIGVVARGKSVPLPLSSGVVGTDARVYSPVVVGGSVTMVVLVVVELVVVRPVTVTRVHEKLTKRTSQNVHEQLRPSKVGDEYRSFMQSQVTSDMSRKPVHVVF